MWEQTFIALFSALAAFFSWRAQVAASHARILGTANATKIDQLVVQTDGMSKHLAEANLRAGHAEGKAEGVAIAKELLETKKPNP